MKKANKFNIICLTIAVVLLIVNVILACNLWLKDTPSAVTNEAADEVINKNAHDVFTISFSNFCAGLWEEKSDFDVQKQQLQLSMCFTAKNASEFASDNDVSDLLLSLQNIALEGNLKDIIDTETIDDINHLSTLFSSAERLEEEKDLLDSINKRLDEILEEIK